MCWKLFCSTLRRSWAGVNNRRRERGQTGALMLRFASIVLFIEPVADGPGLLSNARFFRFKPSLSRDAVTFHFSNTHFCQAVAGFSAISPSPTLSGYKRLPRQTGLQPISTLIVTTYNLLFLILPHFSIMLVLVQQGVKLLARDRAGL